jgi:hypothetical protein
MRGFYQRELIRTAAPAVSKDASRLEDKLRITRAQLDQLISRKSIGHLVNAGYFPPLPTIKARLDWFLKAEQVSFGNNLVLAQTPVDPAAPDEVWARAYSRFRAGGFHYDQVTDSGLLAAGTGGLITGIFHVQDIKRSAEYQELDLRILGRLRPNRGDQPLRDLRPSGNHELDAWTAEHLGSRYAPRRGLTTIAI